MKMLINILFIVEHTITQANDLIKQMNIEGYFISLFIFLLYYIILLFIIID
jgi:hypothetical protein